MSEILVHAITCVNLKTIVCNCAKFNTKKITRSMLHLYKISRKCKFVETKADQSLSVASSEIIDWLHSLGRLLEYRKLQNWPYQWVHSSISLLKIIEPQNWVHFTVLKCSLINDVGFFSLQPLRGTWFWFSLFFFIWSFGQALPTRCIHCKIPFLHN